jgi:hypothetical protein
MAHRYLTCAETAKLLRTALKENFPGVKFTVKSHTYSGGASIRVGWTEGPRSKEVTAITRQFTGASFDPMIDLKTYVDREVNGELIGYGADYIFINAPDHLLDPGYMI